MASFVREGFQAYTQEYIARTIQSRLFKKIPLLYLLAGLGGNQTLSDMKIGRPGSGEVFSGASLSKTQREIISGFNSYQPVIHFRKKDDTKQMGARDTMPSVTNPTTESQDQNDGTAKFNWCRKTTPILVWNESLRRAETSNGTGLNNASKAVANIMQNAADEALNVHLDAWQTSFWTGNPINQTADLWSDAQGLIYALDDDNVYGNVNRGVAANIEWTSNVISTATAANLADIIDGGNLDSTKGTAIFGDGIDVLLTTPTIYRKFKAEARAKGYVQVISGGLPKMGEYGFQKEVLRYDNTYIMYDPTCPSGYVAGLSLPSWKVILDKQDNFAVGKYTNLRENGEGFKDAHQAFVDTRLILACDCPRANFLYTSVS